MTAVELRTKVGSTIKVLSAGWNFGFKVLQPYLLGTVIACSYIPLAWVAYKNTFAPGHTDFSDAMIAAMYLIMFMGVFFTSGLKTLVPVAIYMFAGMDAASFMLFASTEQRGLTVILLASVIAAFPVLEHGLKYVLSKSYRQREDLKRMLRKFARPRRNVLKTYFKKWYPSLHGLTRGEIYATRTHLVFELHRLTKHPDVKLDSIELSQRMAAHVTVEEIQEGKRRIVKVMAPHGTNADHVLAEGEKLDLSW